jgi:mRNA interferase RelE/StbE
MYEIRYKPKAAKFIEEQQPKIQRQLIKRIESLAQQPRTPQSIKLEDQKQIYRIPSGNYRILYQIQDNILLVLVLRIAHRQEVYKHMSY